MRLPSLLLLVLATALGGCERGCLSSWLESRGGAGAGPSSSPVALTGTDCSDGLARCVGGRVEVSRAALLPNPCPAGEARCACPWEPARRCTGACADEKAEVFASREVAEVQLCRPQTPVARPPLATDPPPGGVCDTVSVACVDGSLRACPEVGGPARLLGVCLYGCEARIGVSGDHGDAANLDGVAAILCARLHAERR